jgi:serine phosphatase RsbU (regulator of sigma subunit)
MLQNSLRPCSQTDVLVVSDSSESRKQLADSLLGQDYRVRSEGNPAEGLADLRDFPADLLVVDFGSDREKSLGFLRAVRKEIPHFQGAILFVAELSSPIGAEEIEEGRIQFLITRPFLDQELHLLAAAALRSLDLELATVRFANQMESDMLLAASIQRSLLPLPPPSLPGLEVTAAYRPSHRLGGDYFDVIDLGENETGLFLGDVAGHGLSAALFPAVLSAHLSQTVVRAQKKNPEETLAALNETLAPMFMNLGRFVTAAYAVFNPTKKRLLYSIAGHPAPVLVRANGSLEKLDVGGLPLGVERGAVYQRASVRFDVGDRLYLFSDGCFEQAWHGKGIAFGQEQFERALSGVRGQSFSEDLELVVEMIQEWAGSEGLSDDVTLLAAQRRAA